MDPGSQRLFPVGFAPGQRGANIDAARGSAGRGEAQGLSQPRRFPLRRLFCFPLISRISLIFGLDIDPKILDWHLSGCATTGKTFLDPRFQVHPLETSRHTSKLTHGAEPPPPKNTMLSTLSLLLPTTVHTNLSRLRAGPDDPGARAPPSEPDYPPWPSPRPPSSSSATVSMPHTPQPRAKRSFGALGAESGASTPTEASCEGAALIRSLRESLVEGGGYGGSGIDWDSVRRGESPKAMKGTRERNKN